MNLIEFLQKYIEPFIMKTSFFFVSLWAFNILWYTKSAPVKRDQNIQ